MNDLFRIFFTGLLISFLGCIPFGTLNIAAMQISISDGISAALMFTLGAALVEMIYVRISLKAIDWVRKQEKLFKILEWAALLLVLLLAIFTFLSTPSDGDGYKNKLLSNTLPKFLLGFCMSAINPLQIPFWFGWSTALFSKGTLKPRHDHYNYYTIGIGLGTVTGFMLFIFGGKLLVNSLNANQRIVNYSIGAIYLITAIVFAFKMFRRKKSAIPQ
jgi:threonine/homoserine/homoserine lactone efflux protein